MIRGTTPTLTFTLPFSASDITEAWITFAQNEIIKLDKPLSECTREGNTISVTLTQAETLTLTSGRVTEIQLACRCGDAVFRSKIIPVPTSRILKDGEI